MSPLTGDRGLGHFRVDETFMPVIRLRLIPGGFEVTAEAYGPMATVSGVYRLFTSEGVAVTENVPGRQGSVTIPALCATERFTFTVTMRFDHLNASNALVR